MEIPFAAVRLIFEEWLVLSSIRLFEAMAANISNTTIKRVESSRPVFLGISRYRIGKQRVTYIRFIPNIWFWVVKVLVHGFRTA